MKSSFHSLIPFLPSLLDHLRVPSQVTPSVLLQPALDPRYIASGRIQQKTPYPTSPLHRNGSSSSVACVFISAGTCLPSRCLTMNVYSDSDYLPRILAFNRHVTLLMLLFSLCCRAVAVSRAMRERVPPGQHIVLVLLLLPSVLLATSLDKGKSPCSLSAL
jgi:hypothetical protein